MADIYLMRHGQTQLNVEHRFQGRADIPLNEKGLRQAAEAGRALRAAGIVPDRIYTSPLRRAMQTAEAAFGLPEEKLIRDDRLAEITFGWVDACPRDQIPDGFADTFFHHPDTYIPPENGETYEDVLARARSIVKDLRREQSPGTIFVVSHAGISHAILNILTQAPLLEFWTYKIENCGVLRLHLVPTERRRKNPGREDAGPQGSGYDWFEETFHGFAKNSAEENR